MTSIDITNVLDTDDNLLIGYNPPASYNGGPFITSSIKETRFNIKQPVQISTLNCMTPSAIASITSVVKISDVPQFVMNDDGFSSKAIDAGRPNLTKEYWSLPNGVGDIRFNQTVRINDDLYVLNDGQGNIYCDKLTAGSINTAEKVSVGSLNASTGITLGKAVDDGGGGGDGGGFEEDIITVILDPVTLIPKVPKIPSLFSTRTASIDNVATLDAVIVDTMDLWFNGLLNDLITPAEVATLSGVSAPIQNQINQIVTNNTHQDVLLVSLDTLKAPLLNPSFTGQPKAPTPISSTNTQQIATTAYVKNCISDLIGGASSNLDTLSEISAHLTAQDNSVTLAMTSLIETKVSQTDYDTKQTSQDADIASRVLQSAYDTKQSSQDGSILSLQEKDTQIDLSLNEIIDVNNTQTTSIENNANNIIAVNNFAVNNASRITTIENIGIVTQFNNINTAQSIQNNSITALQGETSALALKDIALDADISALHTKDTQLDADVVLLQNKDTALDAEIATLTSSKAPKFSPSFSGIPIAPTPVSTTNTTQIATTQFVKTAIGELINGSAETLDTLNELATALGNDPNFASTVTTSIGTKLATSTYNTEKATIESNITTNANAISANANRLTTLENSDIQSQIDSIVAVDVVQQNTLDLKANISNQTMDNLTSRQTINVAEKILPLTVSSNLLTANYANGAVFFVSNLTAAANWECLVTNVNPTSSTGCSNVITLLIDASVYHTFAATCKINGTTRTLQFAGGIDAVDMTGATTICQTISVVYSGGSGVPIAVLSSVVPFF